MYRALLAGLLFATVLCACAQDRVLQRDDNPEAVAEVKALEQKLADLIVQGNWDEYSKFLASDYVRTIADGRSETRDQTMATLRSGEPKIVAMIPEDVEVRLYGDTAILTGKLIVTARQENKVRERHSRFTEVFIRRNGHWFLAASQTTPTGK
jgi:ketosteroid isomerase-like protein